MRCARRAHRPLDETAHPEWAWGVPAGGAKRLFLARPNSVGLLNSCTEMAAAEASPAFFFLTLRRGLKAAQAAKPRRNHSCSIAGHGADDPRRQHTLTRFGEIDRMQLANCGSCVRSHPPNARGELPLPTSVMTTDAGCKSRLVTAKGRPPQVNEQPNSRPQAVQPSSQAKQRESSPHGTNRSRVSR
jgi:hypothetical protein